MTQDEKLAAILAAVQTDPGNRGLAKDPHDNLFTACKDDFAAACCSLIEEQGNALNIMTGFFVPTGSPPAFETDGPLGAAFLMRGLCNILGHISIFADVECTRAVRQGLARTTLNVDAIRGGHIYVGSEVPKYDMIHSLFIEQVGRAADGKYYSMRGRDITDHSLRTDGEYLTNRDHIEHREVRLAIGDGGNEIGMGKIPHETIVKNIPNGDLIHCRVPADYLIVAGVSNWGAYALAAGVFVLRNEKPPADLFDPDLERRILEIMVREGPLVDGVTGKQTATVDGLSWEEYIAPFNTIRDILELPTSS